MSRHGAAPVAPSVVPELTVAMPAYNTGKYIGQAIESVLAQEGVEFELVIIDDASEDDTAAIVRSFSDPRITLLTNERRRGIAYCHNRILDETDAPFVAHVDSDDVVLVGAFQKLLDAIRGDCRVGQAHCHYLLIGEDGSLTKARARASWRRVQKERPPDMDYRREMLVKGSVMNTLRTYRREVFDVVGRFDENLRYGEDYEMGLRILERFEIRQVPEILYAVRRHPGSTTSQLTLARLRFWWQRAVLVSGLLRRGQIRFPRLAREGPGKLLLLGLFRAVSHTIRPPESIRTRPPRRGRRRWTRRRRIRPPRARLRRGIARALSLLPAPAPATGSGECKWAYYTWCFPTTSETFLRLEISGLRRAGFDLQLVAHLPGDMADGEPGRRWAEQTIYLKPRDEARLARYRREFLLGRPLRFALARARVAAVPYPELRPRKDNRRWFDDSLYLAGTLRDHGIRHVHSAWADSCAFRVSVAASLLGIPYSVHARAHDLHRDRNRPQLAERIGPARLVVTNCHYNEKHLRDRLPPQVSLRFVYEGVDLASLEPPSERSDPVGSWRLLTVARLIEEKGLVHLLDAARILADEGREFVWEVVGGSEEPDFTNYRVALLKRHRALALERLVVFRGHLAWSEVVERYRAAHVFALPCVVANHGGRDTTPNSLLEAMAMELPVVSTRVSAIPELIEDGVSGLLVPPGDAPALAEALLRLMDDGESRRQLGRAAGRRVADRFDTHSNAAMLADVLRGGGTAAPPGDRR